ncbi:hypothetical protein H5410_041511 [Solanum commersonii]|uniref:DUF7746 domain-containing protein n=1 Tax=Solanum commersonii TaxID=4109 RepID=A0A9J5XT54_SOLCO|nr:hypothetical protein H5410_041511 [Solanum commersonii]
MLMYITICKANKNSDKTIADMITTGFTGQLKGRWSDNSETIRTLLQNLGCKNLTSFRFYKDVFLNRVMELPECNNTHWKSKFMDELLALFSKGVRKTLRGEGHSINYDDYTYGKLINIPKANSKDKKHSSKNKSSRKDYKKWKKMRIENKERRAKPYKEKKRFYKSKQKFDKVKGKIKNLDIDDNIKESLCKIMLNFDSGKSETRYSSHEESSTSDDLKALYQEEYISSNDDCLPCQQGLNCENEGEEDDLYKIYSSSRN